ncbi:hypothetical protein DPMN_006482 [Dreissena polymorpha]|uniref:Uncharacterized protein n=1 Tax=Dreissena polymorpha TaxID=45954 RepID=A0A9D4RUZ3_DREPO|nr:hypothetical protein DPMN_006482 [Dreissena polymorpha]
MADSASSLSSDRNSYISESFREDKMSDIEENAQPYQFEPILRKNEQDRGDRRPELPGEQVPEVEIRRGNSNWYVKLQEHLNIVNGFFLLAEHLLDSKFIFDCNRDPL